MCFHNEMNDLGFQVPVLCSTHTMCIIVYYLYVAVVVAATAGPVFSGVESVWSAGVFCSLWRADAVDVDRHEHNKSHDTAQLLRQPLAKKKKHSWVGYIKTDINIVRKGNS